MQTAKAALKFFLFFLLCAVVVPAQLLVLLFTRGNNSYIIPFLWQKGVCRIFSVKVIIHGQPHTASQTIFISNHLSYLDIPAIGSIFRASFVAKKDVESWPVFGFLSKLQQTAFISRNPSDARKEKYALDAMLDAGKSLIIFPEGTSTDGRSVIPFKSSLFAIAYKENLKNIRVQPITLSMQSVDGRPVKTQDDRDLYSWHLNMDTPLHEHLWRFAKSSGAVISLVFHPPLTPESAGDRKKMAQACYDAIVASLEKQTQTTAILPDNMQAKGEKHELHPR